MYLRVIVTVNQIIGFKKKKKKKFLKLNPQLEKKNQDV